MDGRGAEDFYIFCIVAREKATGRATKRGWTGTGENEKEEYGMEPMTLQKPKIGAEEVRRAAQILKKYKQGKAHLESRIIDNEQFWKMRHWQQMGKNGQGGNPADPQPTSGWLVNCILSKHADAMDCYPEPTVLPREEGDRMEAGKLTKILPVVLKQNRSEEHTSELQSRI